MRNGFGEEERPGRDSGPSGRPQKGFWGQRKNGPEEIPGRAIHFGTSTTLWLRFGAVGGQRKAVSPLPAWT